MCGYDIGIAIEGANMGQKNYTREHYLPNPPIQDSFMTFGDPEKLQATKGLELRMTGYPARGEGHAYTVRGHLVKVEEGTVGG